MKNESIKLERRSFVLAVAVKFFGSALNIVLFPLLLHLYGGDFSSQAALTVSTCLILSVIMRLGLDQYISRVIVYGGVRSPLALNLWRFLVSWGVIFSLGCHFFAGEKISLVLMSGLALSYLAGAVASGLGKGSIAVVFNGLLPVISYYFSVLVMLMIRSGDVAKMMQISGIILAVVSSSFLLFVFYNKRNGDQEDGAFLESTKDALFFSFITIIRISRNELPVIITAPFAPNLIWFVALCQRAINIFPSIQSVVNVLYFKSAFKSQHIKKIDSWKFIVVTWIVVVSTSYALYRLNVDAYEVGFTQFISILVAGFASGYIIKYGNIGIYLIAKGKIRQFFISLLLSVILGFGFSIAAFYTFPGHEEKMAVPIFAMTLMFVYSYWGKYVDKS